MCLCCGQALLTVLVVAAILFSGAACLRPGQAALTLAGSTSVQPSAELLPPTPY